MILYGGGKAQGMEEAVHAEYGENCDRILYPEREIRERIIERDFAKISGDGGSELTEEILTKSLSEILSKEKSGRPLVVISNLVGCGVIPVDPKEEQYREIAGRLQVKLAENAAEVYRVTAGIPERIK